MEIFTGSWFAKFEHMLHFYIVKKCEKGLKKGLKIFSLLTTSHSRSLPVVWDVVVWDE